MLIDVATFAEGHFLRQILRLLQSFWGSKLIGQCSRNIK
jgi:hypothetical protein